MRCFFVSDLHGNVSRYLNLYDTIIDEKPDAVFLGGDLLPHFNVADDERWNTEAHPLVGFARLQDKMGDAFPRVFLILGNDDPRSAEKDLLRGQESGLWEYVNQTHATFGELMVIGYSYVPPTPFRLKDWEKYDVSRYVPPGSVSPEDGMRSVDVNMRAIRFETIAQDLADLASAIDVSRSIWLFHSPPHETNLDRADLDGKMIDHVLLDVQVGSIAIRRFIEKHQPLVTLHGHIHESTRITGSWRDLLGRTHMFNAAHDGPELALVRFATGNLDDAERELI
jgi:Icc-related predicted phosphoesterase